MKKNIFMRTALILLSLTLATTSFALTNAKYYTPNVASAAEIRVYHLLPAIVAGSGTTGQYDVPAGKWAFYVRGGTGSANSGETGGKPGIIRGIYEKTAAGYFYISQIAAPDNTNISDRVGGAAKCIFNDCTTVANPNGTNGNPANSVKTATETQVASLQSQIVAVAGGGGGGSSGHKNGGDAGFATEQNGPYDSAPSSGSGTPIQGGMNGNNNNRTTAMNGQSGGGGGGNSTSWWYGGTSNANDQSHNGGWLKGGMAGTYSNGLAPNVGGGGAGIFGGGGGYGHATQSNGAGGGGASYTGAIAAVPVSKYGNPTTYYEYAVNYFIDSTPPNANTGDRVVVLVWLGP